jgi:TonB family protein
MNSLKQNFFYSLSLHVLFFTALLITKPSTPRFEGYPTILPVELVGSLGPVSYQIPEGATIPASSPESQIESELEPKELEGITLETEQPEKPTEKVESPTNKIIEPNIKKEDKPKEQITTSEPLNGDTQSGIGLGGEGVRLDVKVFPFSYYLALLRTRIIGNWEPPHQVTHRTATFRKTIIYFKIQRNGSITNIFIEKTSGEQLFDQAALRAVTLANPLPPLPYDFPERELGVHFKFGEK